MKYEDKVGDALKQQRFQMLQDIAEELSGEISFPTTFDLTIRLRDTLSNPDWTGDQVAELLKVEPLISSRLLGLVNSAAYNTTGSEITDIKTALVRLGINIVRNTALSIAIQQMRRAKSLHVFKDLSQQLWDHSIRTASTAYVLSKHYGTYNPDEAMLAGMIHDIGAFYLLYRASQYEELIARPDTVKHLIFRWHEGIGSLLLETLGVPEEIIIAIREHDVPRPNKIIIKTLSDIIYVANILAGSEFELGFIDYNVNEQKLYEVIREYDGMTEEVDQYENELRTIFS
ncbi:MAG: HDOD domain-containing protein [Gammaproteobacteria bacterium]|nr:HDOD domain-containing protein [Gammaproteobacteria bacterium]